MKQPRIHPQHRSIFSLLMVLLVSIMLSGCHSNPAPAPQRDESTLTTLPAIPPRQLSYDYTQRPLAEMTEDARAQYIKEHLSTPSTIATPQGSVTPPASPFGDAFQHSPHAAGNSQRVIERGLLPDERIWTTIGPGYSPFLEIPPSYHPNYDCYVVRSPHERHSFPTNTLLFGTLGGIIGHQSDQRDAGILIGGTYGVLLDLMRW